MVKYRNIHGIDWLKYWKGGVKVHVDVGGQFEFEKLCRVGDVERSTSPSGTQRHSIGHPKPDTGRQAELRKLSNNMGVLSKISPQGNAGRGSIEVEAAERIRQSFEALVKSSPLVAPVGVCCGLYT